MNSLFIFTYFSFFELICANVYVISDLETMSEAQTGSSKRKTAVVLLIVLVALSSMVGSYEFAVARQSNHLSTAAGVPTQNYPLAAQLSVKVYDKGILQASVTENDDMVMNNFMNFLQSWMSYEGSSSAPSTFTMTDNTGT